MRVAGITGGGVKDIAFAKAATTGENRNGDSTATVVTASGD
jgi:hypothetical protein